jgi:phosphohistidine phosphatase
MLEDHARPLNDRGRRDAPIMSAKLKETVKNIDICVSSTAKRAKSTAKYYRKSFDFKEYMKDKRIYGALLDDMLELIIEIPDEYNSAIFFGHNPTFTDVYNHFSDKYLDNLPTAGVFSIVSTAQTWDQIDSTNAKVEFLLTPKSI